MLQEYNPKNKDILVYVGDRLYKRDEAKVSVFDSTVQNGDAVWEGLRVYPEGIVCLDKHLTRIHEGAKALAYEGVPSKEEIRKAIKQTLNGMNFSNVEEVRQGKFFEINVNESNELKAKTQVEEMCKKLLANLVIEDYKII